MEKFKKEYEEFKLRNHKPEISYQEWLEMFMDIELDDENKVELEDDLKEWDDGKN